MKSIQLSSHVGADGVLRLEVPAGVTDQDVDVVVVIEPRPEAAPGTPETHGWPPGFFEQTAGAWQGEPLERPSQGDYEERESLE